MTVGLLSFAAPPSAPGLAQAGIAAMFSNIDYAFIDQLRYGPQVWKATGGSTTVDPYSLISATGYPTGFPTGYTGYTMGVTGQVVDPADGFNGRWVLEWDGAMTLTGSNSMNAPSGGTSTQFIISANRREYEITAPSIGTAFSGSVNIVGIATPPTKIRFYRKAYETLLNGGQQWDPDFIAFYKNFGRVRFMDWFQTNGNVQAKWSHRTLPTHFSQRGLKIDTQVYCGLCTVSNGDYTTASALSGNPSSWTDGQMVQCYLPTAITDAVNVQSFTLGTTTTVNATAHGKSTNQFVQFSNGAGGGTGQFATSGMLGANSFQIIVVDVDHFTLNGVNSSTWNGTAAGSVRSAFRLFCGSLPVKSASGNDGTGLFGITGIAPYAATFVYNAAFDKLIYNRAPAGDGTGTPFGVPIETLVDLANNLGPGVQPWFNLPHLADDDYFTNYFTYIRDNLNPAIKFCIELSNEVWNTAAGFGQSQCYLNLGQARWGYNADTTKQMFQYYGYRFHQMGSIAATVLGGQTSSRVNRIMAIHVGDPATPPAANNELSINRFQCPSEGYLAGDYPISYADEMCGAPYYNMINNTNIDANQIWNIVYSGNPTSIQTGLNYIDNKMRTDASGASMTYFCGGGSPPFTNTSGQFYNCAQLAANYGIKFSQYEGGFNSIGGSTVFINNPSNGVTITFADFTTAMKAYWASAQYGQFLTDAATGFAGVGGIYPAQYCVTAGSFPFALLTPNRLGTQTPAYLAFRAINGR